MTDRALPRIDVAADVLVCDGQTAARPPQGARVTVLGRYLVDPAKTISDLQEPFTFHIGLREHFECGRQREGMRGDTHLDSSHAVIVPESDGVLVEDLGTMNGVYLRITKPVALEDGARLRLGRQVLVFRELQAALASQPLARDLSSPNPGVWGRIDVMLGPGIAGWAQALTTSIVGLGRDGVEIPFADDPFVSRHHCSIRRSPGGPMIEDLGSTNGTFKRLPLIDRVPYGSLLLLGRTLLRVDAV